MKKLVPFPLLFVALFLSIFFAGCEKETDPGNDIAYISIHNATNAALNFFIGQRKVNDAALARGSSTSYVGVYEGTWTTEAILSDSAASTLERVLKLTGNENTSIFVIKPDTLDYFMIKDDLNERNTARPKIKFLNLSPDAGTLSLEFELLNDTRTFPGVAYKAYTAYQEFDEKSSYQIRLYGSSTQPLVESEQSFDRGKLYTIWVTGSLNTTIEAQQLRIHITEVK